jgi:eukaryotic-like serine/threonine-protein kinase
MTSETISHYRIIKKLGAGGMGEVYLAEDVKLRRKVAIKLLPAESMADQRAKKRLVREAQTAARLDHPNICAIHEVGEEDSNAFIVMQYVEGETLSRKMLHKPLELKESIDIAAQVAGALAEAHSRGIVHRDLKPQNIMVSSRGQVKVLDFGLAKLAQHRGSVQSTADTQSLLTEPGVIVGTVPYLSPEQVREEKLDGRSDIFSFGAVLYEMVAGRRSFAAESNAATISAILTEEPPPLARYAGYVPPELERIVRKCLEKDRERRYQSAREVLIDLQSLRKTLSTSIPVTGEVSRQRRVGVPRFALIAVAVLVLLAAGSYLLIWRQKVADKAIDSIAVLPFANLSTDANAEYLSEGITDALINSLSQLAPKLKVRPTTSVLPYKGRAIDAKAVGRELNVQAVVTGKVMERGDVLSVSAELADARDNSHIWGEQYNRRLSDILAVQEEISREISQNLRLRLSGEEQKRLTKRYTDNTEAYRLYLRGRYHWNKRTSESLKKAIEYFQRAIDLDGNYAAAHAGLADCYVLGGGVSLPPTAYMPRAKAEAEEALRIDNGLAEAHATLAFIKTHYDWDWLNAEKEFKQAIELNSNYPTAHHWYADYLGASGRQGEAIAETKRAQELDPASPILNSALGGVLLEAGQYDQAIAEFQKAIEIDPDFWLAHLSLGSAYLQTQMYKEALAEFQQAVDLSKGYPQALAMLGYGYAVSGKRDEAQKLLKQLIELSKHRYISSYNIGVIYIGLGDKDRAFEWLDRAYQERSGSLIYLKVRPMFDSLRRDPRFSDLLRRVRLAD